MLGKSLQANMLSRIADNKRVYMALLPASATGTAIVYGLTKERAATGVYSKKTLENISDRTLEVYADGSTSSVTYRFKISDFAVPETPTLAEVVIALNADTTFGGKVLAATTLGCLSLASKTSAGISQIKIGAGTANVQLGLLEGVDCDVSANTLVYTVNQNEEMLMSPPVIEVFDYTTGTGVATKKDIASNYAATFDTVAGAITLTNAGSAITALVVIYF